MDLLPCPNQVNRTAGIATALVGCALLAFMVGEIVRTVVAASQATTHTEVNGAFLWFGTFLGLALVVTPLLLRKPTN